MPSGASSLREKSASTLEPKSSSATALLATTERSGATTTTASGMRGDDPFEPSLLVASLLQLEFAFAGGAHRFQNAGNLAGKCVELLDFGAGESVWHQQPEHDDAKHPIVGRNDRRAQQRARPGLDLQLARHGAAQIVHLQRAALDADPSHDSSAGTFLSQRILRVGTKAIAGIWQELVGSGNAEHQRAGMRAIDPHDRMHDRIVDLLSR